MHTEYRGHISSGYHLFYSEKTVMPLWICIFSKLMFNVELKIEKLLLFIPAH